MTWTEVFNNWVIYVVCKTMTKLKCFICQSATRDSDAGSSGNQTFQLLETIRRKEWADTRSQPCICAESEGASKYQSLSFYRDKTSNTKWKRVVREATSAISSLLLAQFFPITHTVPPEPPPVIFAPNRLGLPPSDVFLCCISRTRLTSLSVPSEPRPHAL